MPITLKKQRLRSGLFGRYFNTYFADNMSNLTTPTNTDVRTQLSSYSVGTTDTWLFRGYFVPDSTSNEWQFRTTSDDASWLWLGSNGDDEDTSLNTSNSIVNNGGLHGSQTVASTSYSLTANQAYPIAVVIGNNSGPGTLTVEFRSNSNDGWESDGDGLFFYNPYAPNGSNLE